MIKPSFFKNWNTQGYILSHVFTRNINLEPEVMSQRQRALAVPAEKPNLILSKQMVKKQIYSV